MRHSRQQSAGINTMGISQKRDLPSATLMEARPADRSAKPSAAVAAQPPALPPPLWTAPGSRFRGLTQDRVCGGLPVHQVTGALPKLPVPPIRPASFFPQMIRLTSNAIFDVFVRSHINLATWTPEFTVCGIAASSAKRERFATDASSHRTQAGRSIPRARKQREFLLGLAANGAACVLTLSASVLANGAPCSPTDDRAHNPCQRGSAVRAPAVLDNQGF